MGEKITTELVANLKTFIQSGTQINKTLGNQNGKTTSGMYTLEYYP